MRLDRMFPVLLTYYERHDFTQRGVECPRSVPWAFVAEHHEQCERNHSQTPERLAERGGLGVAEMLCVVRDQHWREALGTPCYPCERDGDEHALPELMRLLDEWKQERGEA